jgi:hypothetical protein
MATIARAPSFQPDLLAFLVGSSRVSNGDLKNARAALCEFDGNFRLDLEMATRERNAF